MIEAVIFDMDGVLIDSQPMHYEVDMLVLKKAGITADLSLVEQYAGMSNPDRWPKYKRDLNIEMSAEELIKTHVGVLFDYFLNSDIKTIDGVTELLAALKDKNFKLAVASSSAKDFILMILDKVQIKDYFNEIVSGEEVKQGKPAPDVFLRTVEKLDVQPKECIVIEDSTNGVCAAKNAGMYCVGYVNKTSGKQDLRAADKVIDHFNMVNGNLDWTII